MALTLVRYNIEAEQGGATHARVRESLKLGEAKSCIVVYGSTWSFECEVHGSSATATIGVLIIIDINNNWIFIMYYIQQRINEVYGKYHLRI